MMRTAQFLSLCAGIIYGQVQISGIFPASNFDDVLKINQFYSLPPLDNKILIKNELLATEGQVKPYKFGEAVPFQLDIHKDGEWTIDDSGTARIWRAVIESPGAQSLGINFEYFRLPPRGELYIIGRDTKVGAFTGRINNKKNGEFAIAPIPGDMVILEYWEAINKNESEIEQILQEQKDNGNLAPTASLPPTKAIIKTSSIVHGFRQSPFTTKGFGDSGNCNIDAACSLGNKYRDQINSVGVFITDTGQRFCTGAVLNNPRQDGRQLFITANHCLFRDTSNFLVGFNYQYHSCASETGQRLPSPPIQTVQGMKLLARWDKSDLALLEIEETIPDSFNVFYAGWTRNKVIPRDVIGVHHPSGDVKKISKYDGITVWSSWAESPKRYHWMIPKWTRGVTEPGSSGSPLFNHQGRYVAHLHGGQSGCHAPNGFDLYGAMAWDWAAGPKKLNRIDHILDPDGLGVRGMSGGYYISRQKGPVAKVANVKANFNYSESHTLLKEDQAIHGIELEWRNGECDFKTMELASNEKSETHLEKGIQGGRFSSETEKYISNSREIEQSEAVVIEFTLSSEDDEFLIKDDSDAEDSPLKTLSAIKKDIQGTTMHLHGESEDETQITIIEDNKIIMEMYDDAHSNGSKYKIKL